MKRLSLLPLLTLLMVMLLPASAHQNQTLIVFAAASLTDAFEEIGAAFEAATPGVEVVFNFAGSSTLAAQILQGAPADVFASASDAQMLLVAEDTLTADTPVTFARNQLALIVPADNPAAIDDLRDMADSGVQLVVAAPGVPVREYTNTLLDALADDPAYGPDYTAQVLNNIVSEEDNVRQVAAKIALGEADAGIVYQSDITPDISDAVTIIPIPESINITATYPIAALRTSPAPELAADFVSFVLSDAGQDILEAWNFISIRADHADDPTARTTACPESD